MRQIKRDFRAKASVGPLDGLRRWGQKVKIQLFQNMFLLHIKLNGIENTAIS